MFRSKAFLSLVFLFFSFLLSAQPTPPSDLEGSALRSWLKTNWYDGFHTELSYSQARIAMYGTIDVETDGQVYCVYSGFNQSSDAVSFLDPINAEHTIPQSFFGSSLPMRSDIHHLFPTHMNVNSARGSDPFGEINDASTDTWYIGNSSGIQTLSSIPSSNIDNYSEDTGFLFEPREDHKGDLARAVFYFYTVYPSQAGPIEDIVDGGDLNILYEWHQNDPVDAWETQRNNRIEAAQGNRNPYVDYPDIVCKAWGFSCSTTPTPIITLNESITDFGTVAFGNVSTTQSYTVSGSDLTANLEINVSSNFQIAEIDNDADYTNAISITPTSGSVTNKTIFVRFNPTSDINGTVNGQITHSSSGASNVNVSLSGVEQSDVPPPSLNLSESSLDFGTIAFESASTGQSYIINATNLTADLIITSSSSFEVSLDDVDQSYGNSLSITPESGSITDQQIFVRFTPASNVNGLIEGTISHTSSGLSEQIVTVSGTEEIDTPATPEINFNFSQLTVRDGDSYEVKLFADVAPAQEMIVTISQNSLVNMDLSDFTTTPASTNSELELTWESGTTTASFRFQVTNAELFSEPSSKSVGFVINSSSNSSYSVGTNNSITLFIEGDVVNSLNDKQKNTFLTYPNPASEVVFVQTKSAQFQYSIINLTGKIVLNGYNKNDSLIDVSSLFSGTYILQVITDNSISSQLILVE
ncbi:endonuclease [Fulvivirga lutea]|uniref:Endonuclease n=1 Tax=Fulvivirga lutea TaxID=2810512 RepID=A0A974ZZP0_9BACT|nr:endonuclease [Fulvivirga lutea]QSE96351.1 endonuclease [Fulvivirga lutea]